MNLKLPEFLLCEDPTSAKEDLFIFYLPTRSLVHVVHTDILSKNEADGIRSAHGAHIDYTYRNRLGGSEKIMFVAETNGNETPDQQQVLARCAHWYGCYLGWESECDDVMKSA